MFTNIITKSGGGIVAGRKWALNSCHRRLVISSSSSSSQNLSSVAAAAADDDDDDDNDVNDQMNGSTTMKMLDSFDVLGLPRQFGISETELKNSYRQLMAMYHPDRHTNKSTPEREEMDELASQVTSAFQLLREPHTRATHLLELLGKPMEETANSELVGMEFLIDVMELRESVDSTSPVNLRPLWDETQGHIQEVVNSLQEAFDDSEDLEEALKLSAQLQYWHRIETAIYEKMED